MLGIIIVAYKNPGRTADYINNQLPHLMNQYTVVVVNNSSTMAECEKLAEQCEGIACEPDDIVGKHKIYIVHSADNLGFAKGNNLGFKFLSQNYPCKYILFSNDDIIIPDQTDLTPMLELLENDKNIGAIGPDIIGLDGHHQSPHRRVITAYRQIGWILFSRFRKKRLTDSHANDITPHKGPCYWVSGAFFLIKSELFSSIDGFDSETFLYAEEPILAERLKRVGKSMYFYPEIKITHLEGGSTKISLTNQRQYQLIVESNCLYYKRYLNTPSLVVSLYKKLSLGKL